MKITLQQELFKTAPILFGIRGQRWNINLPDDLYPFIYNLAVRIEKFNRRYRKRYVRVLKITITDSKLEFTVHRQVPCINKAIASTQNQIRLYRKQQKQSLLKRAKAMQSTALFASRLLPDWKKLMPDDKTALRQILHYAEKCALSAGDWEHVGSWYARYLRDRDARERCLENASKTGES